MSAITPILTFIQSHPEAVDDTEARAMYAGVDRRWYRIRIPALRAFLEDWAKQHQALALDAWLAVVDGLYQGKSREEKISGGMLLALFPQWRRQVSLDSLYAWLGELHGWKEVDYTCQSVFTAQDMLADWAAWVAFLRRLAVDERISRRRAALVLLVKPVRDNPDASLLKMALENIAVLQTERDIMITKAISWLLRESLKHHADAVQAFINTHAATLPKTTLREVQNKLKTGKKNG